MPGVALDRWRRDLDADQAVSQCGGHPTRPTIAVATLPAATLLATQAGGATVPPPPGNPFPTTYNGWQKLTSNTTASPYYATNAFCTAQCWYDQFVYTPAGYPDIVYVGGSYSYGQTIANKRAVVLSTDAGVSGTDMTFDGTDPLHPNGLHPDQHALVTNPDNPFQFFEASDGGVVRSAARSSTARLCDDRIAG